MSRNVVTGPNGWAGARSDSQGRRPPGTERAPGLRELLLVRHCESSGQHAGAPLTEAGMRQSLALAELLVGFEVECVVSSPFRRALQTIAPFASRTGLRIEEDPGLAERTLSAAPLDDWRVQLRRTWQDFGYRAPGGETSAEAQRRGRSVVDRIAARGHGCAVVVSHGNLIGLVLNGIDARFDFASWEQLTNPDVYALRPSSGGYAFERVWRE
jgi:2,3-bisphosphoglycerate-dependent phosphoglycerate mutase